MRRLKLTSIATALLLLLSPLAMAQGNDDGYGDYTQEVQTTNSPAGTAVEPGSQLLYLLDTGIDAAALFGDDPDFDILPIVQLSGGAVTGSFFGNFISITNSNPTDAVTVHFRYFNQHCEDVLDFLVVLTCNDTMLIDPFNYTIPGTTFNVSQRLFGDPVLQPELFAALPGGSFGDGRFLLFVTASGDVGNDSGDARDTGAQQPGPWQGPEDLDNIADWLFPNELAPEDLDDDCPAVDPLTIGNTPGFNDENLNIFNSSAISFNYLTGFHTVAVAVGGSQAAVGVSAWARPAVNASIWLNMEDNNGNQDINQQDIGSPTTDPFDLLAADGGPNGAIDDRPDNNGVRDDGMIGSVGWAGDGDGPLAPKRTVLSGTEEIFMTLVRNDDFRKPSNQFYLRQDAHGGDTVETNCEGSNPDSLNCNASNPFDPHPVLKGALGWTLFPIEGVGAGIPPADQFLYMLSVKDDYNGSNNPNNSGLGIAQSDNSYRMDSAATYYDLVIYNNDEDPLQLFEDRPPVSPPPPFTQLVIRIAVKCIVAFEFEIQNIPGGDQVGPDSSDFVFITKFGTFSIADLFALDNTGAIQNFLAAPVPVNDELGPGWIRFDRIFTRDFFYDVNKPAFGFGVNYDGERGTYVTIAKSVLVSQAFGVGWYLPQSATNVSDNAVVVADHEAERDN